MRCEDCGADVLTLVRVNNVNRCYQCDEAYEKRASAIQYPPMPNIPEYNSGAVARAYHLQVVEKKDLQIAALEIQVQELKRQIEYVSGYEADLKAIDRVLDQVGAPHDPEEGVSLTCKRIRLLAEKGSTLVPKYRCAECKDTTLHWLKCECAEPGCTRYVPFRCTFCADSKET